MRMFTVHPPNTLTYRAGATKRQGWREPRKSCGYVHGLVKRSPERRGYFTLDLRLLPLAAAASSVLVVIPPLKLSLPNSRTSSEKASRNRPRPPCAKRAVRGCPGRWLPQHRCGASRRRLSPGEGPAPRPGARSSLASPGSPAPRPRAACLRGGQPAQEAPPPRRTPRLGGPSVNRANAAPGLRRPVRRARAWRADGGALRLIPGEQEAGETQALVESHIFIEHR